jgi:predicted dehydrogenase
MAQQSLPTGKHLFLEKATAMSVNEAQGLYERSRNQILLDNG